MEQILCRATLADCQLKSALVGRCMLSTSALSHKDVTSLHVFNDLYIPTNECLPFMKCFNNYMSVTMSMSFSLGLGNI